MYKSLDITIVKATKEFQKLKFMVRTDDKLIYLQIINIDRLITTLICDHNYTPAWKEDYERLCDNYYEPIRARDAGYVMFCPYSFSRN